MSTPQDATVSTPSDATIRPLSDVVREYVQFVLQHTGGNTTKTARLLRICRQTVPGKLKGGDDSRYGKAKRKRRSRKESPR